MSKMDYDTMALSLLFLNRINIKIKIVRSLIVKDLTRQRLTFLTVRLTILLAGLT
jgi:hypothetical protein